MKSSLLDKSFRILERIVISPEPVTLKELAADLNLNTSTVSRITSDLTERRLIRKAGYHSFVPSTALFRMGQSAFDTPLIRSVETLLRQWKKDIAADLCFACIESDHLLFLSRELHSTSEWLHGRIPAWRSPLAAVILSKEPTSEKADRFFKSAIAGELNKLNIASEGAVFRELLESAKKNSSIIFKDPRLGWSIIFPVEAAGQTFGFAVSGKDVEKCSMDKMYFDCSRMASRLRSVIDALFY